jgi:uncharacterized protein (DUF58 family)
MGLMAQFAGFVQRLNPLAPLRARLRAWWQSRLPATDTYTLHQRNVYILPTRAGWMLAATLMVLLISSINYQLNLGYLLTFLIAGSAVVGMHVCHGNLRGLTLQLQAPAPQHAGQFAQLEVRLSHERKSERASIGVAVDDEHADKPWSYADVPPQGSSVVHIGFKPEFRGRHALPLITAETRFPLGTFRVWTVWKPAADILVYPKPEAHPPALPAGEPRATGKAAARTSVAGEFEGVREYRRGDPLKLVVWKKAAKSDQLVSRDTEQAQMLELWLDFAQMGALSTEAKLSRLTAWVLSADKNGQGYGLRLPGRTIAPDSGEAHKRNCLEALALV